MSTMGGVRFTACRCMTVFTDYWRFSDTAGCSLPTESSSPPQIQRRGCVHSFRLSLRRWEARHAPHPRHPASRRPPPPPPPPRPPPPPPPPFRPPPPSAPPPPPPRPPP